MPLIGMIVEGEDDQFSYEIFFKKINPELDFKTYLLHGCDKEKLNNIFPILRKKIKESEFSGYKKGLIICDCDKKCAPEVANFIKDTLNITDALYDKIKIHATCEELETLFLTCIEDISFEINGKRISFKKIKNPENISNPKERLESLLYKEGIIYGREVAREMASQVDIIKLKEKSQNFKRLYNIIDNLTV
jgi:hypothetical protein